MPPIGTITARHGLLISARFQAEFERESQTLSAISRTRTGKAMHASTSSTPNT